MSETSFTVVIPDVKGVRQGDEEHFFVQYNGQEKKLGFHDYGEIYTVPNLYEYLFYDTFKCQSPEVVCTLLEEQLDHSESDFSQLKVLDLGAGNGMVGEELIQRGAESVVGVDIIPEAGNAVQRDRPGIYDAYFVADITDLPEPVEQDLKCKGFNCLTVVAALGFDDIPPQAFAEGYNLIETPGWVAFNIKDEFVCERDATGFCNLLNQMIVNGIFEIKSRKRYRHRFRQDGEPLYYDALIGIKHKNIPPEFLERTE